MKTLRALSTVSLVLVWSAAALAQDAVKVDPAHYKVVFENASIRVLKIGYAPGEKSSMHQHPDAIVVPLAASKVRFALPEGKSELTELANESPMLDMIDVRGRPRARGCSVATLPSQRRFRRLRQDKQVWISSSLLRRR